MGVILTGNNFSLLIYLLPYILYSFSEHTVYFSYVCSCRIYLMGQSAGAHIAACTLLEQAIKECGEGGSTSWSVSQIKAYFGLSGG